MRNKNSPTFAYYFFLGILCFFGINAQNLHAQKFPESATSTPSIQLTADKGPFTSGGRWTVRAWLPGSSKARKLKVMAATKGFELSYPTDIAPSDQPQMILIKMRAGPTVAAGSYAFFAEVESEGQSLGKESFSIEIQAHPKLVTTLEEGPEFLTEKQPVTLQIKLKNDGNTKLEIEPHIQLPDLQLDKGFTYASLEPGQSQMVTVYLTPVSQGSNIYTLSLGWKNKLSGEVFFEAFRFRLYRSTVVPEKLYSVPSTAKVFFTSERHRSDSGYQIKGSGSYNPKGNRRIDYELTVPTRYQLEDPSNATVGYITWDIPKFRTQIGDQSYNVGSFIENSNRGRGLGAKGAIGPFQIGGYFQRKWNYQRNIADPSKARQQGYQTTYSNQWSKVSVSYFNRKDPQISLTSIHQIAADTHFYNPGIWQCALNWGFQEKGTPLQMKDVPGLSKHPQALTGRLELLRMPKVNLGLNFSYADTGFNSGYSDSRLFGFNISSKNSSRVNWSFLANQSRTNLKRLVN